MEQRKDLLYVIGFTSVLGILSLLFLILPKQAFSEMENRSLQAAPILSWERIWSSKFAGDAELFITDHFPFRNEWVAGKSALEQLRLQQENNGIYKGKDGYLFEKFAEPDYDKLSQYADAVKQFAANNKEANFTFMLSPNSIGLYPDRLPWLAQAYAQTNVNDYVSKQIGNDISFLNGSDFLKPAAEDDKPIFYRTDHHWTSYGSYLAYAAYAKSMGWKPMSEQQFRVRTVTDSFLGSLHTRSQFSSISPDSIEIYEPKQQVSTEVYIADTDTTMSGLYDESFLDKKDKYSYFQGGVHALMKLRSELAPGKKADLSKLLVVKDSYAHSLLPFLTSHVEEIHVIDVRYYNGSVSNYIKENAIEDVLLLFNTSTFVTEQNLLKLKY